MSTQEEKLIQKIELHFGKQGLRKMEQLYKRLRDTEAKIKKLSTMKIAPKVDTRGLSKLDKELSSARMENAIRKARKKMETEISLLPKGQQGSARGVFTQQEKALRGAKPEDRAKAMMLFTQRRQNSMDKILDKTAEIKAQQKASLQNVKLETAELKRQAKVQAEVAKVRKKVAQNLNQSGFSATKSGKFRADLNKITQAFKRGEMSIDQYRNGVERLNRRIAKGTGLRRLANQLKDVRHAVVGLSAAYTAFNFGSQAFRIGGEFESIQASMLLFAEDSKEAASNFEFVRKESRRLGQDLRFASEGFVKIGVAGKESLDPEQIRELFTGFSEFATSVGTSKPRFEKGIQAIAQMLAKGQVMSEELRQQLSEQVPGSLQVFAKALNVSEKELFEMAQRGELVASEVLPKVAKEFSRAARAGGALAKQLNNPVKSVQRMINSWEEFVKKFFKSGFGRAIGNVTFVIEGLIDALGSVVAPVAGGAFLSFINVLLLPVALLTDALVFLVEAVQYLGKVISHFFGEDAGKMASGALMTLLQLAGAFLALRPAIRLLTRALGLLGRAWRFLVPSNVVDKLKAVAKTIKGVGRGAAGQATTTASSASAGSIAKSIPFIGTAITALTGGSKLFGDTISDPLALARQARTGQMTLTDKGIVPAKGGNDPTSQAKARVLQQAMREDNLRRQHDLMARGGVPTRSTQIEKMADGSTVQRERTVIEVKTEESEFFTNKVSVVDGVQNLRNNITE